MKDKTYDLTRIELSPKHNLGEHKCLNEGALHRILYTEKRLDILRRRLFGRLIEASLLQRQHLLMELAPVLSLRCSSHMPCPIPGSSLSRQHYSLRRRRPLKGTSRHHPCRCSPFHSCLRSERRTSRQFQPSCRLMIPSKTWCQNYQSMSH